MNDSLAVRTDSLAVPTDSLNVQQDTTAASGGIDSVVTYSCADSIVYDPSTRTMSMFAKSDIKHQQMQLNAEHIDVNWTSSTLTARGIPDSSDTTKKHYAGTPVMKDGGEEYRGYELSYNFKSKRGKINAGDTEVDQGYYHGEEIKKIGQDVLFVEDGRYTTCDSPEPHYYFFSPKMKITMQENIVAEPVFLNIADVPVFALPFAVFPNKSGRRSGIIAPAYGEDASRGKFLRHLGYYLALNDYMDLAFRGDLYSKGGWSLYSDYRYSLRYYFSGSISGEYKRLHTGETSDPGRTEDESYRLSLLHSQQFDPTMRLNVNFTFASNNSFRNTIDLRQALDQSINSNATLSKSWEGTPNSMTLNISRRQNLVDGSIDETLPAISFNHSQSYPFRRSKSGGSDDDAWYEMIGMSYGASATNTRSKINRGIDSIKVTMGGKDTLQRVEEFERDKAQTLNQNIGISIAPKLGRFTIVPSMSYTDQRSFASNNIPARNPGDSSLILINQQRANRAGFFSTGISASTKFYGMFQPNILGISAFRHTVTPNLSFTYSKQIIGDVLPPKSMSMGLSIGNLFEMKTTSSEEGKEGDKIQLLNLNGDIAYDFAADSLNFSDIGLAYRTNIGRSLDISGNASFDLYKLEQTGPNQFQRVNKFLLKEEGRLARLTNFSINVSTSLSGEKKKSENGTQQTDTTQQQERRGGYYGVYQEEEPDFSIPWRLQLSLDFSENKVEPYRSRSSNIRGNFEFNLTENWKFSMGGGYDLINKEVVVPDIHITRDLHCWVMDFSWVPLGNYSHYQLEIRVKAPQLQDIKVTKQGSGRGIY